MMHSAWQALAWAAQTADKAAPAAGNQPSSPFQSPMFLMIGLIFIMFYFMILRPQKQEQKKREALLNSIAKGDRVITSGGIHGTIEEVSGDKATVVVGVAPKISLRFSRAAISTVVKKKAAEEAGEEKEAGK